MAKRSAEHQITREGGGLDDDDVVEESQGFKRASDEALASRPMKGLPKRRGMAPSPAGDPLPSSGDSSKKSTFSGFAGFGALPPATSTPPTLNAEDKPSPFAAFSGFGAPPAATTTSPAFNSTPSFGAPLATTSKPSQLYGTSQPSAFNPLPPKTHTPFLPSTMQTQPPKAGHPPTDAESTSKAANLDYYLSLRGLNHSVIAALEQAIVTDPFVDLPLEAIAKTYVRYRKEIEEKRDKITKPAALTTKPEPSKPPGAPVFSLPAPPPGGLGFGGKPLTPSLGTSASNLASTSQPSFSTTTAFTSPFGIKTTSSESSGVAPPTTGFTPFIPKPDDKVKPSPFSLPSTGASSIPFSFGNVGSSTDKTAAPTINFGAVTTSQPTAPSTSAPLAEGTSNSAASLSSSAFTAAPRNEAKGEEKPKPSISPFGGFGGFGATSFGSKTSENSTTITKPEDKDSNASAAQSASLFSGLGATKPPMPSFFSFGKTSSTPAATQPTGSDSTSTEKRPSLTPGFGFGAGTPKTSFSFGSPSVAGPVSGSLGNPVGFSFGSPPKDSPFATAASTGAGIKPAPALGFSFGSGTPLASAVPSSVVSADSRDTSPGQPADPAPAPETVEDSVKDVVGEGEQNEETLVNQRGKAYRFLDGTWVDKGIIYFKVKKDRETGKHRILSRNETSGRVVINFNLFPGFKLTAGDKNTINFVGQDANQSATFKVRFKTADQVQETKRKVEEVVSGLD